MKICIDIDDYQIRYKHQLKKLLTLKKLIPNFKVTLFTVPKKSWWGIQPKYDFIEYVQHGLWHTLYECKYTGHDSAIDMILRAKRNKFTPGFKAPNWAISEQFLNVLKKLNYWVAIHPSQKDLAQKVGVKYYMYNSLITKPWVGDFIKATGHIHRDCYNDDIDTAWKNLLKLPKDAEYKFVSEVVNEEYNNCNTD